jgi:Leucine-rich repeat (LRR) protein
MKGTELNRRPSPKMEAHVPDIDDTECSRSMRPPSQTCTEKVPTLAYAGGQYTGEGAAWFDEPRRSRWASHASEVMMNENMMDEESTPDAFPVQTIRTSQEPSSTNEDAVDATTNNDRSLSTLLIEAEVVPNDEEMANIINEAVNGRVQLEVDARLQEEREGQLIAEVVQADSDGEWFNNWKTRFKFLALLCTVIAIIAVVAGVLLMSLDKPAIPTSSPEEASTTAPTIVFTDEFELILDAIDETVSSDSSVFQNKSTVQYAAMNWLANEDAYNATFPLDDHDSRVLVERYVMAVFYFSTVGESWKDQFNYFAPVSVCDWVKSSGDEFEMLPEISCDDGQFISSISLSMFSFGCCWEKALLVPYLISHCQLFIIKHPAGDTGLSGELPTELGLLNSLTWLDLGYNFITNEIPTEIFSLKNLMWLALAENNLHGTLPMEMGAATQLVCLSLYGNAIQGKVPSGIYNLSNAVNLALDSNLLTGTVSSLIGSLTMMMQFELRDNLFVGDIPSEIGLLTSLSLIDFSSNLLEGAIPTEVGRLSDLRSLWLANNNLGGEIPSEIGLLVNADSGDFILSRNRLEGFVPTEVGLVQHLWNLDLENNKLGGEIPSEIGLLSNLKVLSLQNNTFQGAIPTEFSNLSNLASASLELNEFTGDLDIVFCDIPMPSLTTLTADICGPSPEVSCSCCSKYSC